MQRVAIFVDAGHLYKRCGEILRLSPNKRNLIGLNHDTFLSSLTRFALEVACSDQVLRTYWYDGVFPSGTTPEQNKIAHLSNVKLRLGSVTITHRSRSRQSNEGDVAPRQKGVDVLIITDLIELSRNKAITDAVLLAGDADLLIAVTMAQAFGVRVHLLDFLLTVPNASRPADDLTREVDTRTFWSEERVKEFTAFSEAKVTDLFNRMRKNRISLGVAAVAEV